MEVPKQQLQDVHNKVRTIGMLVRTYDGRIGDAMNIGWHLENLEEFTANLIRTDK